VSQIQNYCLKVSTIAVIIVSQKNEKNGKGRTDLFLSLSGEHVHTWAPLAVRAESVF